MAESQLVIALKGASADPDAFGAVYASFATRVLAYATRRVLDVELASDVMAETFARAYFKSATFRGESDAELEAWLYAIARRQIASLGRKRGRERAALQRLGLEPPRLTETEQERILELAEVADLRVRVRQELEALTPSQRDALRLRIVEEQPYEDVAAQLGVTQQVARQRVARGLRTLAAALDHTMPTPEES